MSICRRTGSRRRRVLAFLTVFRRVRHVLVVAAGAARVAFTPRAITTVTVGSGGRGGSGSGSGGATATPPTVSRTVILVVVVRGGAVVRVIRVAVAPRIVTTVCISIRYSSSSF